MTKKDYEQLAIATAFIEDKKSRDKFTNKIINILKNDNARFNETIFKNAIDEQLWKIEYCKRY